MISKIHVDPSKSFDCHTELTTSVSNCHDVFLTSCSKYTTKPDIWAMMAPEKIKNQAPTKLKIPISDNAYPILDQRPCMHHF